MDKDLYAQAAPIKVDMSYLGFQVSSQMKFSGGGGGCSGCGTGESSCSC